MHTTKFDAIGKGGYQISRSNAPQNYGYNGIELKVPLEEKKVFLSFKGIEGEEGFKKINLDKAGWRYGFLAVKENGNRVYGKVYSNSDNTVQFEVPKNTENLWLVVSGAPTEHWETHFGWGGK